MGAAATAVQDANVAPAAPTALPAVVAEPRAPDRHDLHPTRFSEAWALHAQGWSARRIARAVGVNRQTVQGWVRSGELPTWRQRRRGSSVDRHAEHLTRCWGEGCRNAAQLWRDMQGQGFRGRLRTVQRWIRGRRGADPVASGVSRAAWPVPSKQQALWLFVPEPERLDANEQRFVDTLLVGSPELENPSDLARRFRTMMRGQQADELDGWLATVKGSALAGFANEIKRDLAAVRAALMPPWSTGSVDGHISRLTTIKRLMCGRAGFKLLRHRVLQASRETSRQLRTCTKNAEGPVPDVV